MASAGPIQAEENTVESCVLVDNIPYVTEDIEDLKNKLTVYFQKSSNGGGDVEEIICPLAGSMTKAIVKFDSMSDARNVVRHRNHCFFDSTIDVKALPPVFLQVSASTDNFYWSAMTKAQSKAVADKIKDMLGKPNNYEKKAHAITRVWCSLDELKEIRRLILEGGPLGTVVKSSLKPTTQSSILGRSIIITDIPYITDDKQQLFEYLETYIKGVIKRDVEALVCGIKGDLKVAVAVFQTIEDMILFFDKHEGGQDWVKFLEETVTVKKIPPVISNVFTRCSDLYLNIIPRLKRKIMRDVMMKRCGSGLTIRDDSISGSLHQICVARTIIMETISLQHPKENVTNVYQSSSATEKTDKDVVTPDENRAISVQPPTMKEDDAYRESALGRRKTDPVLTSKVTTSQDNVPYMTNDETKAKSRRQKSVEETEGILNHPEKAIPRGTTNIIETRETSDGSYEVAPKYQSLKKVIQIPESDSRLTDESSMSYGPEPTASFKTAHTDPLNVPKTSCEIKKERKSNQDMGHCHQERITELEASKALHDISKTKENYEDDIGRESVDEHFNSREKLNDVTMVTEEGNEKQTTVKSKHPSNKTSDVGNESDSESNSCKATLHIKKPPSEETGGILHCKDQTKCKDTPSIDSNGINTSHLALNTFQDKRTTDVNQADGSTPKQMIAANVASNRRPLEKMVINKGDEFAQVESAIYTYVVEKRKDEFDAIQISHGVTISAKPTRASIPNKLTAEVKRVRGKDKTPTTDNVLEAKREFLTLYSDTISNITTESLNCDGYCAGKLAKAEQMLNTKFTDILLLKENKTQYILCGNESSVNDGIREFCLSAGIHREYTEHFTVDKIGFQFLKQTCKDELNALEKKYSVYVKLNESSSKLFNEQLQVHIKPGEPRGQTKKHTAGEMVKAKDAFVTLYQNTYFGTKRAQLNCQGVRSGVLEEAAKTIRDTFPDILIVRSEHEGYMLCGKEMILKRAIQEFRSVSGLLPTGRKLRKTESMKAASIDVPDQTSSNELLQAKRASTIFGQPRIASEDLPSVFATNEGIEVIVLTGDITKQHVNVIVNTANPRLKHSRGGVSKAISTAAGPQLQRDSDNLMYGRKDLMISECIDTMGYNLPCGRVVHTVGPTFTTKKDVSTFTDFLKKTFVNVLKHADGIQNVKTIAIPLISSGNYGGPKDSCAEALASALNDFSQLKTRKNVTQVYLVNIDEESTIALQQSLTSKFPSTSNQDKQGERNHPDPIQFVKKLKTKEGLEIVIARGDISNTKVDVIVNVANEQLQHGRGVVGAISKATGRQPQEENDRLISQIKGRLLHIGDIVETDAIKLPCKKLLHVVGPKYNDYPEEEKFSSSLKQTFLAVLKHANINTEASSIALPLISSEESGGSKRLCSKVLAEAVNLFSENEATLVIKTLFLVNIDVEATETIYDAFQTYFTGGYRATTSEASEDVFQFKTAEGILLNAEESDITKQRIDGIVNPTDANLKHYGNISKAISKAAGNGFKDDCREIMKKRSYKYLQSAEVVHTAGGDMPCKTVLHTVIPFFSRTVSNPKYIDTLETMFIACLKSANGPHKLTSVALPLIGAGQNKAQSDMCAIALAKAIEIVSRVEKPLALKQIKVVSSDHDAVLSVQKTLGHYFQPRYSGKQPSTMNQVTQSYQIANPNQAPNIHAGTSASGTEVTSEIVETTNNIRCQICYSGEHLKSLESCGHTFCQTCIKKDIAPKSSCYICKALYCVTEEKTLNGTMTYYFRSAISLSGEIHSGAIIIFYEFPSGVQKSTHPNPGKPYNGTRSLAYLPYNKDGFEVVLQLRTAFVAGITFDVKPNNTGGHRVYWSGLIPHKRNIWGGITNHGYPDIYYMAQVKAALDKELRKINRKPQGSSF